MFIHQLNAEFSYKIIEMKKNTGFILFCLLLTICMGTATVTAQTKPQKQKVRYDTIIVKHVTVPAKKPVAKPVVKPVVIQEIVLPTPEFINQPYYFDKDGNKLIKLENANALMVTKKKNLGLQGAKQFLSMDAPSSKIRFTAKKKLSFLLKQVVM